MVADYCHISIFEVDDLDAIDFFIYRRDAFIYAFNQTEAGREYLANAWRLEATKPDRKKLRQNLGKGG